MKLILKGMLIGVGKIIPGVSGSIIAISLGIYEQAISCITHFFSDIKNNAKYLSLLGIGIVISISSLSGLIFYLLNNYYIMTMFLFIGLILGSNKHIKIKSNRYNYISLITFSIVLLFGLLSRNNSISFNNAILRSIYMVFIGIVEAATMIIPGISGTATLMMLGAYDLVLKTYSNMFNITLISQSLSIILPLFIGIIIGTYLVSKLINYLFIKHREPTNKAITGFLYGTLIYMLCLCLEHFTNYIDLILGILLAFAGYWITKKSISN